MLRAVALVFKWRRIYLEIYDALIQLRPDWASAKDDAAEAEKDKACVVKVVMTGSADDGPDWHPHIRRKDKSRKLANRVFCVKPGGLVVDYKSLRKRRFPSLLPISPGHF